MAEDSIVRNGNPTSEPRYNVCIVHSGSEAEISLERFIRSKLSSLRLSCGPMNYDNSDADVAIFNDNLRTINCSQSVVIVFSRRSKKNMRCRFERLFALHLYANKATAPQIIPVALGKAVVPEKYRIIQHLVVEESSNWSYKLLQVLAEKESPEIRCMVTEEFANEGKENYSIPKNEESNDKTDGDFNELRTAFDVMCFELLDDFFRGSDSLEEDEEANTELKEIESLQRQLCEKLESASIQTKLKFSQMNSTSGLFPYIGQMGLNNVHKILMNGCGMTVRKDMISLNWKTFEQNLLRSTMTLADIVNFSKFIGIRRIAIQFNKETHDAVAMHYGTGWKTLLVAFAEKILQRRFTYQDKEMLTYRLSINGNPSYATQHVLNETGRKLFLKKFRDQNKNYSDMGARLETYRNWPQSSSASPTDLAKTGFIYSGYEDTVTCFSCNQSMSNIMNEDPYGWLLRHMIWNDNCAFLKSHRGLEGLKPLTSNQSLIDFCLNFRSASEFSCCCTRLSTFDSDLPMLKCLEFARAGFYQVFNEKETLCVICYHCGVKINSVQLIRDPWVEHIRRNPNCEHVIGKKGKDFIKGVLQVLRSDGESPDDVFVEVIIETIVMKQGREEDREEDDSKLRRKLTTQMEEFELD